VEIIPNESLFYATTHGKKHPLSADTVEKMLKRYAVKCQKQGVEMPVNVHCHMIRKTRAMDLYQQGDSFAPYTTASWT